MACTSGAAGTPRAEHRSDIQGLRALAVALVVCFHLWRDGLPGGFVGVDVFFVISGFLITSHLINSRPTGGRDAATFWMRRIRRLLPAALTVIVVTLLATRLFAPITLWRETGLESMFSAMYGQNWHLSARSVGYLAENRPSTPLEHYWSLSVEEQFYLLWPLLLIGCVLLARRLRRSLPAVVLAVIGALALGSLLYSIAYTRADPAQAYFVTPTRMWELAVGGLVAAWVARPRPATHRRNRLGDAARAAGVWLGFAAIGYGVLICESTDFPGWRAAFPVLGTAAVIAAGCDGGLTPNRLLAVRPAQYLGDISYSMYLWHWPLIVLAPEALGRELEFPDKLGVLLAAVLLAGLTKHHVEDRFRRAKRQRSVFVPYRWAAVGMAVVVGLGLAQVTEVDRRTGHELARAELAAASTDPCFGAAAMRAGNPCVPVVEAGKVVPGPVTAPADMSFSYRYDCVLKMPFTALKSCVFGDPHARRNVALVGNSHATHWLPALQRIALAEHFRITTFFSEKCFATTSRIEFPTRAETENCYQWGRQVLEATRSGAFDLVITSERTYMTPVGGGNTGQVFQRGYSDYLKDWLSAGRRVLVIRDVPAPHATLRSVPECVARNPDHLSACAGQRSRWIDRDPLAEAARNIGSSRLTVANLTDWFCTATSCPAVIGGAMVYFDASHLTATYSSTLAPVLTPIVVHAMTGRATSPLRSKMGP